MILLCNGVVLILVAAFSYVAACVIWHVSEPIREFIAACVEHGEYDGDEDDFCPDCDHYDAWDRGHELWSDRELGVSW